MADGSQFTQYKSILVHYQQTMEVITVLLTFLIGLLIFISYFIKRNLEIWKRLGVPEIKPHLMYGIFSDYKNYHPCIKMKQYYDQYKGKAPFLGFHVLFGPSVLTIDLDLMKNICVRDFNIFYARQFYYNEKKQPLTAHMFATEGHRWKNNRTQLTPTFTSGKMKFLFPNVVEIGQRLNKRIQEIVNNNGIDIEMKDIWSRYTIDVIGNCVFGIECNALNETDSSMQQMGQRQFLKPRHSFWMQNLLHRYRKIGNFFDIPQIPEDVHDFFYKALTDVLKHRKSSNVKRNDFIQLLLEVKDNANVEEIGVQSLTLDQAAAEAFIFFVAGFETSSTLLGFCAYELGLNQDIQQKARQEVKTVLGKYEGKLTYEALLEMVYLEQVLNETLRKYPPVSFITRSAAYDYVDETSKLKIPKNCIVYIPIYALQHDPELYPNPELFDPSRFTPEAIKNRHPMAFIPFGAGPRTCIGLRFGIMQAKIALALFLLNFQFKLSSKMTVPLKLSKAHFIIGIEGGIFLNVSRVSVDTN